MTRPPTGPDAQFEQEALSHLDAMYAVAYRLTRGSADGEDLVQDAFVKAMRARSQFSPGTNMRAWLLRILTNTFINRYRRHGLERSVFDGPDADPLADGWIGAATLRAMRDPEALALRSMLEGEIERALDALPEDFRMAVLLADVEELSYREVADAMDCPIGTVMSRLYRGRKLLKAQLYESALAMGIVDVESEVGGRDSQGAVDLASYRRNKEVAS